MPWLRLKPVFFGPGDISTGIVESRVVLSLACGGVLVWYFRHFVFGVVRFVAVEPQRQSQAQLRAKLANFLGEMRVCMYSSCALYASQPGLGFFQSLCTHMPLCLPFSPPLRSRSPSAVGQDPRRPCIRAPSARPSSMALQTSRKTGENRKYNKKCSGVEGRGRLPSPIPPPPTRHRIMVLSVALRFSTAYCWACDVASCCVWSSPGDGEGKGGSTPSKWGEGFVIASPSQSSLVARGILVPLLVGCW